MEVSSIVKGPVYKLEFSLGSVKSVVYLISSSLPSPKISRLMEPSIFPPSCVKVKGTPNTPEYSDV